MRRSRSGTLPIIVVDGDSRNTFDDEGNPAGKAVVKWGWIDSTAQYTIRGRKLPYFWFGLFHHSHYGWELTAAASDSDWTDEHPAYDATSPVDSLEHPITDLELYEVYAFQLNYTIGSKRYFSAREAYVWPSDRAGGAGAHAEERVATFPLNYPQPDKKYSYVVCEETFPGRITEWKDFIKHAFSQWELATDGLVSTERVDLLDENNNKMECPDFSEYIEDVRDQVLDYMENSDPTREQIEEYVKDLLDNYEDAGLEAKQGMDARINDITMIDDNDDQDVLVGARVFAQVSRRVSSGNCGPGAIACASVSEARLDDGSTIFTTDIILTSSTFEGMSLDLPGTDTTASEGEIPFNTCLSTEVKYSTLVHEAGHALGITYGPERQYPEGKEGDRHHPTVEDAAMSYELTPDCSPHPLDVMAIYALYQTVD